MIYYLAILLIFSLSAESYCLNKQSKKIFNMPFLAKYGFASPSLEVRILGERFVFLVDTGAPIHIISSKNAEKLGFKSSLMKSEIVLKNSSTSTTIKNQYFIIQSMPNDFDDAKIAGILSPQMLLQDLRSIQVDISNEKFLINGDSINGIRLLEKKIQGPDNTQLSYFLTTFSVGQSVAFALIDSGAEEFIVDMDSEIGRNLSERATAISTQIGDLYGTDTRTYLIKDQGVNILDEIISIDVFIKKFPKEKPGDAILGTKALRNCNIYFSKDFSSIRCLFSKLD